jgi:hypothetical protein
MAADSVTRFTAPIHIGRTGILGITHIRTMEVTHIGYPYNYSYYPPAYSYDAGTVAAVQHRLGELGYYHGVIDGVIGPRTRAAVAAYEGRHGLVVDGTISAPLLDRLGLA